MDRRTGIGGGPDFPNVQNFVSHFLLQSDLKKSKSATFTYERVPSIVIKINQLFLLQSLSTFLLLIKYFQFQHLGSVQCDGHHCNQHLDIRKLFTFYDFHWKFPKKEKERWSSPDTRQQGLASTDKATARCSVSHLFLKSAHLFVKYVNLFFKSANLFL